MRIDPDLQTDLETTVDRALSEDVGTGDLTASLVPASANARATIVTREPMTLAGTPWVEAIFKRLDKSVSLRWSVADGETAASGATLCSVRGPARAILTGERAALNVLQTLSATATETARYVHAVAGTGCKILDTRKTLPGLRHAQKYAVRCGGGTNHRMGLYDAILIKENHIASAGSIAAAVRTARDVHPHAPIEVEVENRAELEQAFDCDVERVLLDNFSPSQLAAAVEMRAQRKVDVILEASGNVTLETVFDMASTGVDCISIGALTKNVRAVDLSMLFDA